MPRRSPLARFLRDPLCHFLLLGGLVFAIYGAVNPGWNRDDATRITVSKERLLTFIQYRSKAFEPAVAEARLAGLSPRQLRQLVRDFIEEEALYREARALGLDTQDYIVKRRMVQGVEFLARDLNDVSQPVSEERLRAYFRDHAERFATDASYTFTHVFIAGEGLAPATLETRASALLAQLASQKADFADAPRFGDRFPYGVNFVEAGKDQIAGEFGDGFARQLAALKVRKGVWQGPLSSSFGAHLVMLVARGVPRTPHFEDVREEVAAEFGQLIAERQTDRAIADIVARYPVDMEFDDPRLGDDKAPG